MLYFSKRVFKPHLVAEQRDPCTWPHHSSMGTRGQSRVPTRGTDSRSAEITSLPPLVSPVQRKGAWWLGEDSGQAARWAGLAAHSPPPPPPQPLVTPLEQTPPAQDKGPAQHTELVGRLISLGAFERQISLRQHANMHTSLHQSKALHDACTVYNQCRLQKKHKNTTIVVVALSLAPVLTLSETQTSQIAVQTIRQKGQVGGCPADPGWEQPPNLLLILSFLTSLRGFETQTSLP